MPNPGGFQGLRKAFLLEQKPLYEKAVEQQLVSETLTDISRRFLKRFPLDRPESWEPTEDELAAINNDEAEEEIPCRDPKTLSPEQKEIADREKKERQQQLLTFRGKIKRWFRYQYKHDHKTRNASSASTHDKNLFTLLLQQLLGKEPNLPRLKTPVNVWRKEKANRDTIEAELKAMDPPVPVKLLAKTRDEIARRQFKDLTPEEKVKWTKIASDDHSAAMAKYNTDIDIDGDLLTPEERQRAIEGIGPFMSPILDALCSITGWKCTFVAGGPEPANGGILGTISVHSGVTAGDVKMNFGRAERFRYKNIFIPIFGDFLRKCYSKSICKEWALPQDNEHTPISASSIFRSKEETIQAIPIKDSENTPAKVPSSKKKVRKTTATAPALRQPETASGPLSPSPDNNVTTDSDPQSRTKGHNPFPEDWPYVFEDDDDNLSGNESNNTASSRHASPTIPLSAPPSPSASIHDVQQNTTTTDTTHTKTKEAMSAATQEPRTTQDQGDIVKNTEQPTAANVVSSSDVMAPSTTSSPSNCLPPRTNHPSVAVSNATNLVSMTRATPGNTPTTISTKTVPATKAASKTSAKRKKESKSKNPAKKHKANSAQSRSTTTDNPTTFSPELASASASAPARSQCLTRSTAPTAPPAQAKPPPVPTSSVILTRNGKPVKSSKFWVYAEDDS